MKWVIIAVLGAGFLLLALCGIGFYFATSATQAYQRPVFETIVAEDPEAFLDLCDPTLRTEVDAPVMLAWMKEVNAVMGECQFESGTNFNIHYDGSPGKSVVTTSGEMTFENGVASSEFVFQNDKLIKFKINPDKLGNDWFTGPASDELYRERTKEFFTQLLERNYEKMKPLMHESFIEVANDEVLDGIVDKVDVWLGENPTVMITEVENRISEDEGLIVHALLEGSEGTADASATFKFDGMKGTVLSFVADRANPTPANSANESKSNVDNSLKD
ncbi:hypothetical protein [Aporhodopirellula aestuarii]|uniref:Uncharacterized protein n=1 Tax=Aporhodopirellula aestuarii TaxID=2950107 RepID=A0ABT0U892_9BACT|nr:hypothetical protein [Aporhodopirellula aestuarii]MCM2373113.1 hypothetical protein [Aporhodopirellula aestuarii]